MKKLILIVATLLLSSLILNAQQWSGASNTTGILHRTGNVGIGTATPTPDTKLTVKGNVNIGGVANGRLRVRHIDGKDNNSADLDHLYLNWNTGKSVVVGNSANPSNLNVSGQLYINNGWARVLGNGGLYFQTHGGGFYMKDNTWIRTYGSKNFYHNTGIMRTDGILQVGLNGNRFIVNTNGSVGIGITNPQAKLHVNGWVKLKGSLQIDNRTIYLGTTQKLIGDNNSALYWRSANSNVTQIRFEDKEGIRYGNVYGNMDGANFGLLDGDGNWSYLAAKDNYTDFKIDNNTKMRIQANGNVGIGTTSPDNKLDVKGVIRAEEVRVQTGWSDHVFLPTYELPTLKEEEVYITENGHLLGFESEKDMGGEVKLADVTNRQQEVLEKLMLHVIELEKRIEELQEVIRNQ